MSKSKFYKDLIALHKKTGQGLTGIVKINSSEATQYLDELIQEGLIKANNTGGSLGHPESNIFYTPIKGYNVWDGGNTMGNLTFVRIYLGVIPFEADGPLQPGLLHWIRDKDAMNKYAAWLKKNTDSLQEMLALDDYYEDKSEGIQLSEEEISMLKEKRWYKENKLISECLADSSTNGIRNDNELIFISEKLIQLYKTDLNKYGKKLEESQVFNKDYLLSLIYYEIDTIKSKRKRINIWLKNQDHNVRIQSII